jgi:hypothetical protein
MSNVETDELTFFHMVNTFKGFKNDLIHKNSLTFITALAIFAVIWCSLFAFVFCCCECGKEINAPDNNKVKLHFGHAVYFTIVSFTCGFSYIHPTTVFGHIIATINCVVGVVWFGLLVAVFAHAMAPSSNATTTDTLPPGTDESKAKGGKENNDECNVSNKGVNNATANTSSQIEISTPKQPVTDGNSDAASQLANGSSISQELPDLSLNKPPLRITLYVVDYSCSDDKDRRFLNRIFEILGREIVLSSGESRVVLRIRF